METKKPQQLSSFCEACPRGLTQLPKTPCPLAILRLELIKDGKRETPDLPGCPWYCNVMANNYCFWDYISQSNFDPMSVKEISLVLNLSNTQVDKAEASALEKIKSQSEFLEALQDVVNTQNYSNDDPLLYFCEAPPTLNEIKELAGSFIPLADDEETPPVKKTRKKRK